MSNELPRGIHITSAMGFTQGARPQLEPLDEFIQDANMYIDWRAWESTRDSQIDIFLRNCHNSIKILASKQDISDELAKDMLQHMAELAQLPIDEVEAKLNEIDKEYWERNTPKPIKFELHAPPPLAELPNGGKPFYKKHKPNTGFTLGSYRYKSKRK